VVAFADAYPTLSPNKLIKELLSVHDSIMRYFTDRAEDVLKDEMLKEAFTLAAPNKKVVLKISERVNASGRAIGLTFGNGVVEVNQQAGAELGSGKAYLDDILKDVLGKLGDSGPSLAVRKEIRDVGPALKSFRDRLEKATGVSGWTFEFEVWNVSHVWLFLSCSQCSGCVVHMTSRARIRTLLPLVTRSRS
jgi:hypothetical protein